MEEKKAMREGETRLREMSGEEKLDALLEFLEDAVDGRTTPEVPAWLGGDRRASRVFDYIRTTRESDPQKLAHALHASEDRWKLVSACTQDGIFDIDFLSGRAFLSERLWEIFRRPMEGVEDIPFDASVWLQFVLPDDREKLKKHVDAALSATDAAQKKINMAEFRILGGDGESRWVAAQYMLLKDRNGRPCRLIGACEDIQERREREDAIRMQATHDQLTGLPNRYLYNDRLMQQIVMSKRNDTAITLMVWDLDGFKAVNDTYGHLTGDHLLVAVAGRMRACLREADTLARFGGDEFVMVLASKRGRERETAHTTVARIFEVLDAPIEVDGASIQIGASCGIAFFPRHASDEETLFAYADKALYAAKKSGKNCSCIWEPDPRENLLHFAEIGKNEPIV